MNIILYLKKIYLLIGFILLIIFSYNTKKSYSQEVFIISEGHFEIKLPADWKKIPNTEIDKLIKNAKKKMGVETEINFNAGFQKRLSKNWFSLPYLLISVDKSGKVPESEITDGPNRFTKSLRRIITSEKSKLDGIIKNMNMNEAFYDKEKSRIIANVDMSFDNSSISGLFIIMLTSYGTLNLYFYSSQQRWDNQYPEFLDIADMVKLDPIYKYESKDDKVKKNNFEVTKTEKKKEEGTNKGFNILYELVYPLFNFLFFILSFIIILLLSRNTKAGYKVINLFSNYKYPVSFILCLIFFIVQINVSSYFVIPLILNALFIYPLSKFLDYCKIYSNLNLSNDESNQKIESCSGKLNSRKDNNLESFSTLETENEKDNISISDEQFVCTCSHCKKDIVVNKEELINKKYKCPDCGKENQIEKFKINISDTELIEGPSGISGWLLLPAIGIVSSFIIVLGEIGHYANLITNQNKIPEGIIYFGIVKNVFLAVFIIIISIYFYRKKKKAPSLIIVYLIISAILTVIEVSNVNSILSKMNYTQIDSDNTLIFRTLMSNIFWIMYFSISKRVQNTFVN